MWVGLWSTFHFNAGKLHLMKREDFCSSFFPEKSFLPRSELQNSGFGLSSVAYLCVFTLISGLKYGQFLFRIITLAPYEQTSLGVEASKLLKSDLLHILDPIVWDPTSSQDTELADLATGWELLMTTGGHTQWSDSVKVWPNLGICTCHCQVTFPFCCKISLMLLLYIRIHVCLPILPGILLLTGGSKGAPWWQTASELTLGLLTSKRNDYCNIN